jgi:4-amino-4-deoxy-L-arabinose transferase-like glycosyltransferase
MDKTSQAADVRPNKSQPIVILLLLLAALALQFAGAAQKSYWEDEAWTAAQAVKSPAEIALATARDRHPPLYFLVAGAWSKVFGAGEVGLRSLSIVFTLASLGLGYWLARRVAGHSAALAGLALLTFSPLLLTYGHTARYYSLTMLLGLGLVSAFLKYLDTRHPGYLALYILLGAGLLYTSYPALGLLLACNVWWLVFLRKHPDTLLPWLAAQLLVAASFVPWLPVLTAQVEKDVVLEVQSTYLWVEIFKRVGYLGYAFGLGEVLSPLNPVAWLGALIVAGMAMLAMFRAKREAWFLLLVLFSLVAVNITISIVVVYPVSGWQGLPNRMLYGLPFMIIWLVAWMPASRKILNALPALLLGVYLLGAFNYFAGREFIKPFLNVPWRQIMQQIESSPVQQTAIICAPRSGDYACWYYGAHYGYKVFAPSDWPQVEQTGYTDVWWLRTNLSEPGRESGGEVEAIVLKNGLYRLVDSANYARQAESLRWLKTRLLGQNDYEYRLNLFHFQRLK